MAYSFTPRGDQWGGSLGGYGSLGMGAGLANSLGVGLNTADAFRRYQNNVYLDPMRLRSQYAGYESEYAGNKLRQADNLGALSTLMQRLGVSTMPGPWANGQQQIEQEAAWQIPMKTQTQQEGAVSTGDPSFGNSLLGQPSSQGRVINTEPTLQELLQGMRG